MLRKIFSALTGGRPMRKIGIAYTKRGSGEKVFYFVDDFGTLWMAAHAWSIGRVRPPKGMVQR